jgi:uncharacterized protein DUF397
MAESTEHLDWLRPSECSGGNCVEVARDGDRILIRNSSDTEAGTASFDGDEWSAFTRAVRRGQFDFG